MKRREDNPWELPYPERPALRKEMPERLALRHTVYNVARRINGGQSEITADEYERLITVLDYGHQFDWRTLRAAGWAIGRLNLTSGRRDQAADVLAKTLKGVRRHSRVLPRIWVCARNSWFILGLLIMVAALCGWSSASMNGLAVLWFILTLTYLVPYLPIIACYR